MTESIPPAEPTAAADEMLIEVRFAARLGEFFADVDSDSLVDETRRVLVQMTESLLASHPHAHLHGDVTVSIQLNR